MSVDHRDDVVLEHVEELLRDVVQAERVLEGQVEPGLERGGGEQNTRRPFAKVMKMDFLTAANCN